MSCIGIDTSNYTTSVACFDGETGVNFGRLLEVPEGGLGLRQSDALFQHVKRLPDQFARLRQSGALGTVTAVGASTQPRSQEGSYMPCFLAGASQGQGLADVLGVPFFAFSHQQGHLAAATWSAGRLDLLERPFLAWHLSGGTTELLLVEPDGVAVKAVILGGTSDISAGQLIDRTGKELGLAFPAGKALDALAETVQQPETFKVKQNGLTVSFSGVQNQMQKRSREGVPPAQIAAFVLSTIADGVLRLTRQARKEYPGLPVLFSGGVASNSLLRRVMSTLPEVYFAEPAYSTDNAMGVAILTHRAWEACQ